MTIVDILDTTPARLTIAGMKYWRWPDGTTAPIISGGDGDPDPDPAPDDDFTPITSQAEFDRMIQDRIRRATQGALPKDELDALRSKAKKFDDLEAESQTELEKERTQRETAEVERTRLLNENKQIKIEAAIIAASAGKVQDAGVAATLILAEPSKYVVTIDDAGQVTGADTAVTTLIEAKKFLAASPGSVDQGQGQGRGKGVADKVELRSDVMASERRNPTT